MVNKYVSFVTDDHLLSCIDGLYKSYQKAKNNISKKTFYTNKVDTIKLTFDSKFNNIDEQDLIQSEILRQIDKSINNSIGTFHEQVLGGISGFEVGNLSGFDIKAKDDTLFAIFGRNDFSENIADAIFHKLANDSRFLKKSTFYFVSVNDFSENHMKWVIERDELVVSQKRVFQISLPKFYALLSGQDNAYFDLINKLPKAIQAYLSISQPI